MKKPSYLVPLLLTGGLAGILASTVRNALWNPVGIALLVVDAALTALSWLIVWSTRRNINRLGP